MMTTAATMTTMMMMIDALPPAAPPLDAEADDVGEIVGANVGEAVGEAVETTTTGPLGPMTTESPEPAMLMRPVSSIVTFGRVTVPVGPTWMAWLPSSHADAPPPGHVNSVIVSPLDAVRLELIRLPHDGVGIPENIWQFPPKSRVDVPIATEFGLAVQMEGLDMAVYGPIDDACAAAPKVETHMPPEGMMTRSLAVGMPETAMPLDSQLRGQLYSNGAVVPAAAFAMVERGWKKPG